MKTYIPLDRLKRSRDSGSALYNMHPTDVLGRAGGGIYLLMYTDQRLQIECKIHRGIFVVARNA